MRQRYFLSCSYLGTGFAGFQVQENVRTVQGEIEHAMRTILRRPVELTGSSRTDAGVHALQNYFHFDIDVTLPEKLEYALNAILPKEIAVLKIQPMPAGAHARFDAIARTYEYHIYWKKDPFREDRAYFFPFTIDKALLEQTAKMILQENDFTSFSKKHTQVFTNICTMLESSWQFDADGMVYRIKGNRFLRGMVRALVGTQLKVARGKISLEEFKAIFDAKDCTKSDFSVPGKGLRLVEVSYPEHYFQQ